MKLKRHVRSVTLKDQLRNEISEIFSMWKRWKKLGKKEELDKKKQFGKIQEKLVRYDVYLDRKTMTIISRLHTSLICNKNNSPLVAYHCQYICHLHSSQFLDLNYEIWVFLFYFINFRTIISFEMKLQRHVKGVTLRNQLRN